MRGAHVPSGMGLTGGTGGDPPETNVGPLLVPLERVNVAFVPLKRVRVYSKRKRYEHAATGMFLD